MCFIAEMQTWASNKAKLHDATRCCESLRQYLAHLLLLTSLQGIASLAASIVMLQALRVSAVLSLMAVPK